MAGVRRPATWPHFGRTRTLNAAMYCAPVSSISAGQRANGQVADRVTQPADQMVAVVPYSSGVQQPVRATAILSEHPHTRWAAPVEREQARGSVGIQMLSLAPASHTVAGVMPGGRVGQRNWWGSPG